MKVYVLHYGEYCGMTDRGYLLGVLKSMEEAEEAKQAAVGLYSETHDPGLFSIDEFELNHCKLVRVV